MLKYCISCQVCSFSTMSHSFCFCFVTSILFFSVGPRIWLSSVVNADTGIIEQFDHEECEIENHIGKARFTELTKFHELKPFVNENGMFELLVKFRGVSDGHVALTVNQNESEPLYMIILGSYNNRFSEIRRTKRAAAQIKMNTPGIMSPNQWRGFVVRFNLSTGHIWVFPEGSATILLFWKDPNPLPIKYFAFTTWKGRSLEVAFDCRAKDKYSTVPKTAESGTPDPKIRKNLLAGYDRMAQPYTGSFTGTTITVPSLNVIHYDVDDEQQTFELHAWIYMTWVDPRLKWSMHSTHDTSGYLHFSKTEIWHADIALYNTARPKAMDEFADDAQLLATSNGTVIWVPPIRFLTNCKMILKRWPFDIQECYLKLGSWTYHEKEIDLQFGSGDEKSRVKMLNYEGQQFPNNTEWVITEFRAVRTSKQYACCVENYVDITYHFKIARKYSTYMYTIIYPIIMISFLSLVSFLLSPHLLPRFLLTTVNCIVLGSYLIYFRTRLPSADHTPLIVKLFTWNFFVNSVSILIAAVLSGLPDTGHNFYKLLRLVEKAGTQPHKAKKHKQGQTTEANEGAGDEFSEDEATGGRGDKKSTSSDKPAKTSMIEHIKQLADPVACGIFTVVTIGMLIYHLS